MTVEHFRKRKIPIQLKKDLSGTLRENLGVAHIQHGGNANFLSVNDIKQILLWRYISESVQHRGLSHSAR